MEKTKGMASVVTCAAIGTAVIAAAGIAAAAYNSKPLRTRRMVKKAGRTMDTVGSVLTDLAHIAGI